jgi:hypothetical protein
LDLHYVHTDKHDHPQEDNDHELPFRHHEMMLCNTFVATVLPATFAFATHDAVFKEHTVNNFTDNFSLNFFLSDIWQPPRIA